MRASDSCKERLTDFIDFFIESLPSILDGLSTTLILTFISLLAGLAIGIGLALGRVYGNKIISGICIGYIEIIRGTPLLVQLFIIYFGFPSVGIILNTLGYHPIANKIL